MEATNTSTPYQLAQLAAFCHRYPIERKILIAPSLQTGVNLTNALVLSGTHWLNLETSTAFDLAYESVSDSMRACEMTLLKSDNMLLSLEDMLGLLVKESEQNLLSGIALTPGLIRSFQRSILALRQAGIPPESMDTTAMEPERRSILSQLYTGYVKWLDAENLADEARVFELANQKMSPSQDGNENTIYAILDETPLSALAYEHVLRITQDRLYRIGPACHRSSAGRHFRMYTKVQRCPVAGCVKGYSGVPNEFRSLVPRHATVQACRIPA